MLAIARPFPVCVSPSDFPAKLEVPTKQPTILED